MDNTTKQKLIEAALAARQNSYSPYSNFAVGAALLFADGTIVSGCNIENASFSLTICAERVALSKALSDGLSDPLACAVVAASAPSPCGACRQFLVEFNPQMPIFAADEHGTLIHEYNLEELQPKAFTKKSM